MKITSRIVLVLGAVVLVACSAPPPPSVVSFAASPATIVAGASTTLSWQVTGADTIVVTDAADVVVYDGADAAGSQVVSPATTTVYTLKATGPGGTASAEADVTVQPATATFTNAASISIPAGAPGTTNGPADPYPATITVSGMPGSVQKVTVTIASWSHTFPGDVGLLLVGPGGESAELLSDVGGTLDVADVTIVFDQDALETFTAAAQIVAGTFRPFVGGAGEAYPAPAPAGPYLSTLDVFNGTAPNGDWQLYVFDDVGGDSGAIAGGWSLTITSY